MEEQEINFKHALNSATLFSEIRKTLNVVNSNHTEWSKEVTSLIERAEEIIKKTFHVHIPIEWTIMIAGLHTLASQITCLTIAQTGEGDLVKERTKYEILLGELRRLLLSSNLKLHSSTELVRQILLQPGSSYEELRAFLLLIPLPLLYWQSKEVNIREPKGNVVESNPMLRVIVFLDNAPIASPTLLKSNILYPLKFQVCGLFWNANAIRLRLDLLTTCPNGVFSVSEFILEKPCCIENGEYNGELSGNIIFHSGQSSLIDDIVFIVRGAFLNEDGSFTEIPVIGHSKLCLRITNDDSTPLMTGNRRMDSHIEKLVTKLIGDCPSVRDELPDLLEILQALTRLLTTYAQEAIYKGRNDVTEAEFQKTVLRDLRLMLNQEKVQEHPSQAGGITDISYHGVIVELKVEKKKGDREFISKKYAPQAVQYAGVDARQVSILLILDLTSKDNPPGDIRNDIILTDVETHGGIDNTKKFPSKAFVFVINGNMKTPSDYSR
ncbi:hypothetical protein [Anaerosinus gibii]|uniref:Uncharacterized protein n=1 Tax=Selenobaculum gibii TaxID=3054208 RepID=A0A9Y2AIY3_9FIRM|nr:hypothetical protein [Selenobaculum gbiensis]WIW70275.1 hypothetical protein P3F81_10300 [Selenobaculum gbiensis]